MEIDMYVYTNVHNIMLKWSGKNDRKLPDLCYPCEQSAKWE